MSKPWLPEAWGLVTIQLSFFLYLGLYLPQLFHNIIRRSTHGLSWLMHLLMITSALCDVGYSLGLAMPWQYYTISGFGLGLLAVQHLQFGLYNRQRLPHFYTPVTAGLVVMGGAITISLQNRGAHQLIYLLLGYASMSGWLIAMVPQVRANSRLKSTEGLSLGFVLIGLFGLSCDTISAYSLNWALPNKIGTPVSVLLRLVLLAQFFYYRKSRAAAPPALGLASVARSLPPATPLLGSAHTPS